MLTAVQTQILVEKVDSALYYTSLYFGERSKEWTSN
jgi:hypothetical protein